MNNKLQMSEDVEKAKDTLGGGGVLDTDIYLSTLKTVYFSESKGGAMSATVIAELEDGSEFKTTQWILSGDAKGNLPYYERNGKKYPLPGYSVIDDLCELTLGMSVSEAETEEKSVKIYDFELQKEVPTEVDCLADIKGHTILFAVQKQLEDKNEKAENGSYVPTGEYRETNEIAKVFNEDGATFNEVQDKTSAVFGEKWLAKNKGKVRDRTSKQQGTAGTPQSSAKKGMFAAK